MIPQDSETAVAVHPRLRHGCRESARPLGIPPDRIVAPGPRRLRVQRRSRTLRFRVWGMTHIRLLSGFRQKTNGSAGSYSRHLSVGSGLDRAQAAPGLDAVELRNDGAAHLQERELTALAVDHLALLIDDECERQL